MRFTFKNSTDKQILSSLTECRHTVYMNILSLRHRRLVSLSVRRQHYITIIIHSIYLWQMSHYAVVFSSPAVDAVRSSYVTLRLNNGKISSCWLLINVANSYICHFSVSGLNPMRPETRDITQSKTPESKVTSRSVANQLQTFSYDSSGQFICDSCPAAWLVIDIWWLKRPVRVSFRSLGLSRRLMPDSWPRPPYKMDCSFSINYTPLLRALHVIACKLGPITFDGHPIYLTRVHLYELN